MNMGSVNIFSNQYIKMAAIASSVFGIVYAFINLFVIGGNAFVYNLNNNITIPLVILTILFAFSNWKWVTKDSHNRSLWGGLLAGWILWAFAEILWVIYGFIYQDVPYPSPADYFWLAGYIPMGYGLYTRLRGIPVNLTSSQKLTYWFIFFITLVLTGIFILYPTLQNNDPSSRIESILNVLYPLVDLFLVLVILRMFYIYTKGDYGISWNLLTAGFLLHSISNLTFSYASLWDLYYPELKVNFISGLGIDVPYNLSYLLWSIGLYSMQTTLGKYRPFLVNTQPRLVPNTSVLIFLDVDHTVIEVSDNFDLVFDMQKVKGKTLSSVLHIPEAATRTLLEKIRRERRVADYPIQGITGRFGVLHDTYVHGSVINSEGEYTGCVMVLRLLLDDDYTLDEALSEYQKSMVAHLRKLGSSKERAAIQKLLLDYHLAYFKQIYNQMLQTGGAQLGQALLDHLQQSANEHDWALTFNTEDLIVNADYELKMLREALPALLDGAKEFASQLTNPEIIDSEIQSITSQFSESVHKNVAFHGK